MPRHLGISRNRRIQHASRMTLRMRASNRARWLCKKVVDSVAIVSAHPERQSSLVGYLRLQLPLQTAWNLRRLVAAE